VERLLRLWDELDDLAGACRHVAVSAADEFASIATPIAALVSALAAGLLAVEWQTHFSILSQYSVRWIG
jgi:hypothetical protein